MSYPTPLDDTDTDDVDTKPYKTTISGVYLPHLETVGGRVIIK
jgi:hypothetical protein